MNKRKIILLIVSITTLILTVFTFSYAWFVTNLTVYLTNLEIEVNAGKGLMISVDGVNYSSNITGSNIKKAIVAKYKNYEFKDGFLVDSDENLVNLSDDDINKIFSEIVLKPITSLDGKTFYKDKASLLETNASEGLYLNFDLYFKSLNDYTNVYFNSNDFSHFEDGSLLKKTSVTSNVIKTVNDCIKAIGIKSL